MGTTRFYPLEGSTVFRNLVLILLFPSIVYAQRGLTNIPDPDPEIERQSFIVAEGFEVNLFASEKTP